MKYGTSVIHLRQIKTIIQNLKPFYFLFFWIYTTIPSAMDHGINIKFFSYMKFFYGNISYI